ncbi:hypothetical protein ABZP36_019652 [Zizania latifolia]
MAAPRPSAGYAFLPADHHLITGYLRPRVAGETFDDRFFYVADAYSLVPELLVDSRLPAPGCKGKDSVWYFFSPANRHKGARGGGRRQRAVGDGCCWHSEGRDKDVLDDQGCRVGYVRKLSYGIKKSPPERGFTRLGWCMAEFGLDDHQDSEVICKVYRSPRAPAAEAPPSTQVLSPSISVSSKRKADGNHPEAPASVRPHWSIEEVQGSKLQLVTGDPFATQDDHHIEEMDVAPPEQEVDARVEMVQTAYGPRSEMDVIAALAMGTTVDELLGPDPETVEQAADPAGTGTLQPTCPEQAVSSNNGGVPSLFVPTADFTWFRDLIVSSPRVPVPSPTGRAF